MAKKSFQNTLLLSTIGLIAVTLGSVSILTILTNDGRIESAGPLQKPEALRQYLEVHPALPSPPPPAPATTDASAPQTALEAFAPLLDQLEALHEKGSPYTSKWLGCYISVRDCPEDCRKDLEAMASSHQELLFQIRNAAQLPGPIASLIDNKGWIALDHYSDICLLNQVMITDALMQAANNNTQRAAENFAACLRMANALAPVPCMSACDLQNFFLGSIYHVLPVCFPGEVLADDCVTVMLQLLQQRLQYNPIQAVLAAEQYNDLRWLSTCRDSGTAYLRQCNSLEEAGNWIYMKTIGKPFYNMYERNLARAWQEMSLSASRPYAETITALEEIGISLHEVPYMAPPIKDDLDSFKWVAHGFARSMAYLNLLYLGLLVEQYHAREGHYPEGLQALPLCAPETVLTDPFDGKPIRYRLKDDTFLLYSVGPNLTDDQGRDDPDAGDILWRAHFQYL